MAANDLTNMQRVKDHLGIKDANADAVITWLVTACSQWMLSQMSRNIKQATYRERYHGDDGDNMTLKHQPVTAIVPIAEMTTGLRIDGQDIPAQAAPQYGVAPDGFLLYNGRIYLAGQYHFNEGKGNVEVNYTAGYASVPEDIEQATTMWVAEVFRGRDRAGLASRTVPSGESVTFRPDQVPVYVQMTIDTYKRLLGVSV
jgi:hypothetical protein